METQFEKKGEASEEFRFGRTAQILSNLFRRLADENLASHGINVSQLRILGYLSRFDGEKDVYQKDLEEAFGIRRSSVTSILQNMEKSGYLCRESSSEDARVKKVVLTQKGRKLDESLRNFIHALEESMMEGIPEEDRACVKRSLTQMLSNLEQIERNQV